MKSKVRPVFPVYESLTFLLLNELIQIENEYSWLCYPYESVVQFSHIKKLKVSIFKWTNFKIKNECYLIM